MKACLLPVGSCPVQSHAAVGRKLKLGPGIYFQAGLQSKVFCKLVGELLLSRSHKAKILTFESESLGDWISWLNTWRMTASDESSFSP